MRAKVNNQNEIDYELVPGRCDGQLTQCHLVCVDQASHDQLPHFSFGDLFL